MASSEVITIDHACTHTQWLSFATYTHAVLSSHRCSSYVLCNPLCTSTLSTVTTPRTLKLFVKAILIRTFTPTEITHYMHGSYIVLCQFLSSHYIVKLTSLLLTNNVCLAYACSLCTMHNLMINLLYTIILYKNSAQINLVLLNYQWKNFVP